VIKNGECIVSPTVAGAQREMRRRGIRGRKRK